MYKIIYILITLILLTSCHSNIEPAVDNNIIESNELDNYDILYPYDYTNSRYWFTNTLSKSDAIHMPKTLQELSLDYFSAEENLLVPGKFLLYDDIQMLQRRKSKTYPYALNPAEGDYSINPTVTIDAPYLINGIYELNFISKLDKETNTGISIAIMLNNKYVRKYENYNNDNTISDLDLVQYSKLISETLSDYLRIEKGIDYNIPILITTYKNSNDKLYVPGNFISKNLFINDKVEFETINEKWYLFPSAELKLVDSILYNEFISIKNQIENFLPESVSMIGQTRYFDDYIQSVNLEIRLQSKSYNETYSLVQYVKDLVQNYDDKDYNITIDIKQYDETSFVISKNKNDNEFILIDMN